MLAIIRGGIQGFQSLDTTWDITRSTDLLRKLDLDMVGESTSGSQRELFKTPVLFEKTRNFPASFIDHPRQGRDRISRKDSP